MLHISRLAEELIVWMSQNFGFIDLSDRYCTGSSIMPQKRNPIASAYIHGCAGAVRQHVAALLDANVADHERSTGPWQIEWITLPEIFCLRHEVL